MVPSALSFHTTGPVVDTTSSPKVVGAAETVLEVGGSSAMHSEEEDVMKRIAKHPSGQPAPVLGVFRR